MRIRTWRQRCEEHPDHDGIVSEGMIQARMQEEIDELRDAIEQAQDPVAWMYDWYDETEDIDGVPIGGIVHDWISKDYDEAHSPTMGCHNIRPLYTAPPQREWQGLTDDEIKSPIQRAMQHFGFDPTQYSLGGMATIGFLGLVKEIEGKLKEKNA